MDFQLEKGCFNLPLRKSCIIIASYLLICIVLSLIFHLGTNVASILGFTLTAIANVALLVGALKNNKWLVLVWLVIQILYFINWPIALLGMIFDFGGYRANSGSGNIIVGIVIHVISLVINVYCTMIVYSFYKELKNTDPQLRSVPTV